MIKSLLVQADPWKDLPCSEPQCTTCVPGEDSKPGQSRIKSLVYQNRCISCQKQGKMSRFVGETGRTMIERGKEHQADALGGKEE